MKTMAMVWLIVLPDGLNFAAWCEIMRQSIQESRKSFNHSE